MDFLLSLISSITTSWIGQWVSKLNLPRLFPNNQTKFWDPIMRSGFVIVTPAEEKEAHIKSQVLDFQGLDELKLQVIYKYYQGKYKQTTCDNIPNEWLQRNLLLVAGPIPNTITRHILNKNNNSVRYYFDGNTIIDKKKTKKVIQADISNIGYPLIDYGIISRLRNPFNRKKWVVVLSGMFGWGTYASLVSVTTKDILEYINKHTKNNEFQVLVLTHVHDRIPNQPSLVKESLHIVTNQKGD